MASYTELFVELREAKNLIACEKNYGTSEPYAILFLSDSANREIKDEKFKSKLKTRTLNPKWAETFTFGNIYSDNISNFLLLFISICRETL